MSWLIDKLAKYVSGSMYVSIQIDAGVTTQSIPSDQTVPGYKTG